MKGMFSLLFLAILCFPAASYGSGIADLLVSVKSEYGGTIQADEMYAFGSPPRAGRLDANAHGLFGAKPNVNPSLNQFFSGVKKLMPSDAKIVAAYRKDGQWVKEVFVFSSAALKKIPQIKDSMAYKKELLGHPVGSFFMIVNHDIENKGRIANFLIVLGKPDVDIEGMNKMSNKPKW